MMIHLNPPFNSPSYSTMIHLNRRFNSPSSPSTYNLYKTKCPQPMDPLGAFFCRHDNPEYSREAMLSPLCLAAAQGKHEIVRFLHQFVKSDEQRDLDDALFLANRQGYPETAALLLGYAADPTREFSQNGIHGAAWRGLNEHIKQYVNNYQANPDVTDESSATPVIYAIFGIQDESGAWETIECLFELGASPLARFGSKRLSYAEIALEEGKEYLAQKLEELCLSPTILNSSRESTCAPGEDDDQPHNKRLREDPELDEEASMSVESICMPGGDHYQPDNKQPQEISEPEGGVSLSRESSCTVGREDNVQPNNKRQREESEVEGGAKRARGA